MKNLITGKLVFDFFIVIFIFILTFLFGSFVLWDFNPSSWGYHGRFCVSTIALILVIGYLGFQND